jgi:putative ABC transport system ATP-binding protein
MIKVTNLFKTVPVGGETLEILRGISFEIKSGDSAAIVGVSGSGKSTLLGLLAGLDQASGGDVIIDGVSLAGLDEDSRAALRAEKVGFVFQSFQLLPALTALENVMLPLELSGANGAEQQATTFLNKVGLGERLAHYPATLSGGEQQRVAIARAFAAQPALLFADEPTGNLDGETAEKIIDLLFSLNASAGTTLILVTHDQRLAARCQRRFAMESGRLSEIS